MLDKKSKVNCKILRNKQLQQIYGPVSQEAKAIRQLLLNKHWNIRASLELLKIARGAFIFSDELEITYMQ